MPELSAKYLAYLQSPAWRLYRLRVLRLWGGRCVCCGVGGRLDIHHLHYRNLYHERLFDCIPLCRAHHESVERWKRMIKKIISVIQ